MSKKHDCIVLAQPNHKKYKWGVTDCNAEILPSKCFGRTALSSGIKPEKSTQIVLGGTDLHFHIGTRGFNKCATLISLTAQFNQGFEPPLPPSLLWGQDLLAFYIRESHSGCGL